MIIAPSFTHEGNMVTIQCRIIPTKVPPAEEITWKHNGKVMNISQPFNVTNFYFIGSVTLDDAGTYTCSNDLSEYSTTLIVIKPTQIVNWMPNHVVKTGDSEKLFCDVDVDSRLAYDTTWFNGEKKKIVNNTRFLISDDNSLTISNVSASDIDEYTCEVSMVMNNNVRAVTKLVLAEVPNPPILNEPICNDFTAELTWKPTENYGPPIESYTILQRTELNPNIWKTAAENIPANVSTFTIELKPFTMYTFSVLANNKIGQSLPSKPIGWCTTKSDIPYKNPENVRGKGDNPTNLIISWTPLPEIEHNGPNFFYRVSWKRDIENEKWISRNVSHWRQDNTIINDQPTYVRYLIKVEAFNSLGKSNATAVEHFGWSGEGEPSEAPKNLTLIEVKNETATLEFERVPNHSINGEFKDYKVQIWNDIDGKNKSNEYSVVALNGTTDDSPIRIPFIGLHPGTRNYLQVCVLNSQYQGPFSDVFEFDTLEGVPSIVQALKVTSSNSSALSLQWAEPEQSNGQLIGYNIYCKEIGGTVVDPLTPILTTLPNNTSASVTQLKPNTKYEVHIAAYTAAGEGER